VRLGLIVGGVQKAGTTSLFGYLSAHPGLLPPRRKELHHFDNEMLDWSEPQRTAIERAFPVDGGRIGFEATPSYLFWPRALERIKAYDPAIRLILVFRDPIERAWSHWRMEVARGDETLSFGEAIRDGRARLTGTGDVRALRHYSYVERGLYAGQLGRALALFPREQMLLLRSNDLRSDPASVLRRVAEFLDIEAFRQLPPRLDHAGSAGGSPAKEDVEYLRILYRADVLEFARISGLEVRDWPTVDPDRPVGGHETTAPSGQRQLLPSETASRLLAAPSDT
jgi:hypothetical protein